MNSIFAVEQDMPLVSLIYTNYNQKKYCEEAFRSLIEQDYPKIEIIVADNCSTDGSDEVLKKLVHDYCARGGGAVFIRNASNLGIIRNFESAMRFVRGELVIACGGDDVSHPNRVSSIVRHWNDNGRRASVIFHKFRQVDVYGNALESQSWWKVTIRNPIGAAMAYATKSLRGYPKVSFPLAYEDGVFARRAYAFGDVQYIDESLIDYRIGSGTTTKGRSSDIRLRISEAMYNGALQTLEDLKSLNGRCSELRIGYIEDIARDIERCYGAEYRIYKGRLFTQRIRAFISYIKCPSSPKISLGELFFYYTPLIILGRDVLLKVVDVCGIRRHGEQCNA